VLRYAWIGLLGVIAIVWWQLSSPDKRQPQPNQKQGTRWWLIVVLLILVPFLILALFLVLGGLGLISGG